MSTPRALAWAGLLFLSACTPVQGERPAREVVAEVEVALARAVWIAAPPDTVLPQAPCDPLVPLLDDAPEPGKERELVALGTTPENDLVVLTARRRHRDYRVFFGPASDLKERRILGVGHERDGGSIPIRFEIDGKWASARFPISCREHNRWQGDVATGPDVYVCDGQFANPARGPAHVLKVPRGQAKLLETASATCFSEIRQERAPL